MTATACSSVSRTVKTHMLLTCGSDCRPFIRLPSYPATDDDSRGMSRMRFNLKRCDCWNHHLSVTGKTSARVAPTMSSFFMFASRLANQDVTEMVEAQQGEFYKTRSSKRRHIRPSYTSRDRASFLGSTMHGRWRLLRVLSRFALRRSITVWGLRTHRARCRP